MTDQYRHIGNATSEVAADSELLILVDEADCEIGFLNKSACHRGAGVLHRAFSLLVFNDEGELLLQQRAASKRLWPLYWSNSCCSHPRRAESLETAVHRRLREELGISCPNGPIRSHPQEVHVWRWISPEALTAELTEPGAERFTPWLRLEWE